MSLEELNPVDAIGIDRGTGAVVLTIADSWGWSEPIAHLQALQAKLQAYFEFIEVGEIWHAYPAALGKPLKINVVFRFAPPPIALSLLARAVEAATEINIQIMHETHPSVEA